jgi:hypothetical protein
MNKVHAAFGTLFGGGKMYEPSVRPESTPVSITAFSQPHVLQQKMKEEKMTHGGTVTANLSPIRLERSHEKVVMYFCPMKTIEVLEIVANGDGGIIPGEVKVEGLNVPGGYKPGYYSLKNVVLTSNGTMQVKATEQTVWEYIEH